MIHFYYGDNDFAIRQHVALVKKQFIEKFGAENVIKLDSSDADKTISEIVNTGLFSANRLLVLDGVFANKDLLEKLASNLPLIQDDTELIVIGTNSDKRTKLYKLLLAGDSKEFKLPKNLNQFVANEAAKQQVNIEKDAIEDLIMYAGGDVWRISGEIAKFRALNMVISKTNIKKYIEPDLTVNVFHILDDVFCGKTNRAIDSIKALRQNEDPNAFFALLSSQVFALSATKNSIKPSNITAKEIGVHPYVISKMSQVARGMTADKVAEVSKIVAEADIKIKQSNKEDAWNLVELVVMKI